MIKMAHGARQPKFDQETGGRHGKQPRTRPRQFNDAHDTPAFMIGHGITPIGLHGRVVEGFGNAKECERDGSGS